MNIKTTSYIHERISEKCKKGYWKESELKLISTLTDAVRARTAKTKLLSWAIESTIVGTVQIRQQPNFQKLINLLNYNKYQQLEINYQKLVKDYKNCQIKCKEAGSCCWPANTAFRWAPYVHTQLQLRMRACACVAAVRECVHTGCAPVRTQAYPGGRESNAGRRTHDGRPWLGACGMGTLANRFTSVHDLGWPGQGREGIAPRLRPQAAAECCWSRTVTCLMCGDM